VAVAAPPRPPEPAGLERPAVIRPRFPHRPVLLGGPEPPAPPFLAPSPSTHEDLGGATVRPIEATATEAPSPAAPGDDLHFERVPLARAPQRVPSRAWEPLEEVREEAPPRPAPPARPSPPPPPPPPRPARPRPPPVEPPPPAAVEPSPPTLVPEAIPPGFEDEPAPIMDEAFLVPRPVPPPDMAEWLFSISMEIHEAPDVPEAARRALQVLLDLVQCDAGSVLYDDYRGDSLEFIAAAGPTAHKLAGLRIPLDQGLAGFCHRMAVGMLIEDTTRDRRFDPSVDRMTGYVTRAILAVPLRTTDRESFGCIELLNSPWGFEEWMIDASQNIATTLAEFVRARG